MMSYQELVGYPRFNMFIFDVVLQLSPVRKTYRMESVEEEYWNMTASDLESRGFSAACELCPCFLICLKMLITQSGL